MIAFCLVTSVGYTNGMMKKAQKQKDDKQLVGRFLDEYNANYAAARERLKERGLLVEPDKKNDSTVEKILCSFMAFVENL